VYLAILHFNDCGISAPRALDLVDEHLVIARGDAMRAQLTLK
jgi:hypothetical protein